MANPTGWQTPYPLPPETAALAQPQRCKNLGLWLERYTAYERKGNGFEVAQDSKKRKNHPVPDQETIQAVAKRHKAMLADYQACGYHVAELETSPDWRVVIGLGSASVLETGLTTHRVYGFPYLPGSSVKGLARAYALLVAEGVQGNTYKEKEQDPTVLAIFGNTERAGQVVFFDAIPLKLALELDIMNPHVADYYQGSSPPADYLSPTPIYFLTIGKESLFYFSLVGRDAVLLAKAQEWLCGALTELGAGGKTTAGYGTFAIKGKQVAGKSLAAATTTIPTPEPQTVPLEWRRGKVRRFQSSRGELVDEETQETLRFYQQDVESKGWSPSQKMIVEYAVLEQEGKHIVKVRKTISHDK